MAAGDIERIKTKLYALNMRLEEVNSEVVAAQARVSRLEQQLEDAKLAHLLGEEAGNPSEIGPQLETSRSELADHQQLLRRIRSSQWETRLRYLLARRKEIQAEQAEQAEPAGE
jgi:chromosome segregation ATPase